MATKIMLVDDHGMIRDGLRALLAKFPDMQVVAEADNGRKACELVQQLPVDVVIMDVAMRDLNGIEATRKILDVKPELKVIGLSMHSDRRFVVEMLKAGAQGYVLKDAAFEELELAICTILSGKVYLSPGAANVVVDNYVKQKPSANASAFSRLSPREREVLQLIAEGRSTKQIALSLNISAKTVETHRRQLMAKLDLFSVAELTKYAIREGLTTVEMGTAR